MDRGTGFIMASLSAALLVGPYLAVRESVSTSRHTEKTQSAPPTSQLAMPAQSEIAAAPTSSTPDTSLNETRPCDGREAWTKATFNDAVHGMKKAEVAEKFGRPGHISGDSEEWVYFHPPICDQSDGTRVLWTAIRFSGFTNVGDPVYSVNFN